MSNGLGKELEYAVAACSLLARLGKDASIKDFPARVIDSATKAGREAFDDLAFYFEAGENVVPADVLREIAHPVLRMIDEALGQVIVDGKFEHVRLLAQHALHALALSRVEFECSVDYVDDGIDAGVDGGQALFELRVEQRERRV